MPWPDMNTPRDPGGMVSSTPGFNRIKRPVVTIKSVRLNTVPSARAITVYVMRNRRERKSISYMFTFVVFNPIVGLSAMKRSTGIATFGDVTLSILSMYTRMYIFVYEGIELGNLHDEL
mgnify:FL=1